MAHFAELDENDIVIRVIVIPNNQEHRGQEFCADDLGLGGICVQTSYNGSMRKNFAGKGHKFDRNRDAFIAAKPHESWVLDEQTCAWVSPIPYPNTEILHLWNEEIKNWEPVTSQGDK
jgi:hypothetical protein